MSFKREAVELTELPGANVYEIARSVGIRANQLHRWRRELDVGGKKAFPGTGTARYQEFLALKLELAWVKKERDFLRDAAAFFAKESSWGTRRSDVTAALPGRNPDRRHKYDMPSLALNVIRKFHKGTNGCCALSHGAVKVHFAVQTFNQIRYPAAR
jgi:transposase